MKRNVYSLLMAVAMLFMIAGNASAQRWFYDDGGSDRNRNQIGIDLGVGKMSDINGNVGFMGGLRYMYNVHRFVGWDVIGVNYVGQTVKGDGIGPSILQGMMGLRGRTPNIYETVSAYTGLRMGYGYDWFVEEGGLALEFNLGLNVTPNVSVGYVFNMQKVNLGSDAKYKFNGFRIGFTLP